MDTLKRWADQLICPTALILYTTVQFRVWKMVKWSVFFWPWQIITINKWANVNTLLLLLLLLCINVPFRKIHFHLFIVGPHLNRNDKKKGQNRQSILIFLSSHNCKRFWVGSFHDPVHLRLVSKLQTSSNFCLFTKLFLNHKKLLCDDNCSSNLNHKLK